MKRIAVAGLLAAAMQLSACGQMGPLYFDEDPPADQMPPFRANAPAAPESSEGATPPTAPETE